MKATENEAEKAKILLVGEDEHLMRITFTQLTDPAYEVVCAPNGRQAMKVINRERIDLMLLKTVLPDGDGCQFCRRIRGEEGGFSGPVIFVSGSDGGADIVKAFRCGGDDYLVKPVGTAVLAERIKANLERVRDAESGGERRWFKRFMIDIGRREVYRVAAGQLGEKVLLSPLEYGILEALIKHRNEVVFYKNLYRDVWQQEDLGDVRSLMVHVSNLRKKLDPGRTEMITAVRGAGYLFQDV